MPQKVLKGDYDVYALQRIIQKLSDLVRSHPNLSLSQIAERISAWASQPFHREYLGRLRAYSLNDAHINTIVEWIVEFHDPDFRKKLTPEAIFGVVGEASRDFYFHFSQIDPFEAWEQEVFNAFAGIYICAPADDRNSYLPMPVLRRFFADPDAFPPDVRVKRALDIKQYVSERSILVLRAMPIGYYHAAEFPMSLLFPPGFAPLDVKMVYEGIGIASGNSVRVFLRECLSRVGKSHSILIHPKGRVEEANPRSISINVGGNVRNEVRADWEKLSDDDLRHLRAEFAETIALGHHLAGTAQIELSPLPNVKNRVEMTFTRDQVYHRKPPDFLRHGDLHFIRPDIENRDEIARIVDNPLAVGALE
ncbi:MAG: hypothetical protein BGO82_10740 [Devosia sp. 67-54]|uniref:hypothetical protein n=1 Tax=unclassified Devosia TaxID=196773 RepID=UPI000966DDA3|nr:MULTISPECIES: hypothetical protein [unclassified Devosia]MBN9304888.1 hypothetical protein [Devosia sp.]OJX15160.1 MAG: hypothetical protein BGO82_10740 [Devosia sp. 67-54]